MPSRSPISQARAFSSPLTRHDSSKSILGSFPWCCLYPLILFHGCVKSKVGVTSSRHDSHNMKPTAPRHRNNSHKYLPRPTLQQKGNAPHVCSKNKPSLPHHHLLPTLFTAHICGIVRLSTRRTIPQIDNILLHVRNVSHSPIPAASAVARLSSAWIAHAACCGTTPFPAMRRQRLRALVGG